MGARLEKTVVDCPDPRALAAFYAEVLGMQVNEDSADWVVIGRGPGGRELAFHIAGPGWAPPPWPDDASSLQLHLDLRVDDVETAERQVTSLGATPVTTDDERGYRVYRDPAGHPFCLVFG
ncbi:VOC family protein [Lapillicoccus jejuensis]|uniref:Glyoxalase/bleomycin resistance protein/dioxygenase superfamily protein n=1 Tax=Lapillicoccus jejuensis TaxID=402171 RepID=A0A542DZW2_9MICO|nr:VOC family protein [Lapillicoccus jejuensis]TQJ08625.1 glyoxalase/bleomycin resistance protein/dioxygenase superfamily protein [Lapillicoccus jejuensis]